MYVLHVDVLLGGSSSSSLSRDDDVVVSVDDVTDSSLSDDAVLRQLVRSVALSTSMLTNATLQSASPGVGWLRDGDTSAPAAGRLKSISVSDVLLDDVVQ